MTQNLYHCLALQGPKSHVYEYFVPYKGSETQQEEASLIIFIPLKLLELACD